MPAVVRGSLRESIQMALGLLDELDRDFSNACGDQLVKYARRFAPVADADERALSFEILTHRTQVAKVEWRKPGTLRDSIQKIRIRKTANGYRTGAKTDDPIAPYVEWDTRAHIIRPKAHSGVGTGMRRDKSGRFVRKAQALRWVEFPKGGGPVIARVRFAKEVYHPGTKGAHFMAKAADKLEAEIPIVAEIFIEEWLKKADLA